MARKCGRRIYKSIGVMLLFVLSFICSVWGLATFPVEVRAAGLLKDNIGKTLNIQTLNGTRWSASTWRKDSSGNYTEYLGHGDDNYFFRAENSDEPLYCVQMRNPFVSGTNTVKNMSDLMDENTIKSVSAGLYYFDQNANGLSPKQKEQGKQCIIWTFTEYLLKGGEKAIKSNDPDSGSVNAVLEKVYRAYNAGELQPTIKDITASGAVGVPRQTSNQAVGAFYYDYNPVGSIEIIKSDSVLGKTGWMSQDGLSAEFIINRSGKNISYHGKSISDGAVLAAVKTMLKNNQYSVLITDVPYGTYEIVETKPGTGYVSSGKSVIVNVKTKGDTVNVDVANKFIRGDMKFQKKCLDKMIQLSNDEQKTILYVSHNMETIRTLCNRCIVLEKGHLVFDGEPEEAIAKYLGDVVQMKLHYTYEADANDRRTTGKMQFTSLDIKKSNQETAKEGIGFSVAFRVQEAIADLHLRCTIHSMDGQAVGTSVSEGIGAFEKNTSASVRIHFDTTSLAKGEYVAELAAVEPMGGGRQWRHAWLEHAFAFEITEDAFGQYSLNRNAKKWGYTVYPDLKIEKCERK